MLKTAQSKGNSCTTIPQPEQPFVETRRVTHSRTRKGLQRILDIKHGRVSGPLCWAVLLASALVFYRVPAPGTGSFINLSLFDPIVALVFAVVAWRNGIQRPPSKFVVATALILAAVVSHSFFMLLLDPEINSAWLVRGTAKLGAIVVLFSVLVLAFQSEILGDPPVFILRILFAICILAGLSWHYVDLPFTPNTLLANNNWLFFFLFLLGQKQPFSARWISINLCIVASLGVVSLVLLSKVGAIIGGLIFISLVASYLREEAKASIICAVLVVSVLSIATVNVLVDNTALLARLDSLAQSVDIRLSLWSLAWNGIIESFPRGIGLEQFARLVEQDATLYANQLKFPHSVLLGLVVEVGLLGVAIIGVMAAVIWRSVKGYPVNIRPVFLAILVPLTFLHDIQGARLLILIVAFGYARWLILSKNSNH